jgi:hypothetical protein
MALFRMALAGTVGACRRRTGRRTAAQIRAMNISRMEAAVLFTLRWALRQMHSPLGPNYGALARAAYLLAQSGYFRSAWFSRNNDSSPKHCSLHPDKIPAFSLLVLT